MTKTSVLNLIHRAEQNIRSEIADVDITASQHLVLRALLDMEKGSQAALVSVTNIDRSTMADIVRRLLVRGFIKRARDKEDARAYVVELTPAGTEFLIATADAMENAEKRFIQRVPENIRTAFLQGLEHVAAGEVSAA